MDSISLSLLEYSLTDIIAVGDSADRTAFKKNITGMITLERAVGVQSLNWTTGIRRKNVHI